MNQTFKRGVSILLLFLLLFTAGVAQKAPTVQAAVPTLDTIRVALFVNIPGKYSSLTKAATLSSSSAMNISVTASNRTTQWLSFPENDQMRLAMNDYKVKVFETAQFNQAKQVFDAVKSAGGSPFLVSLSKKNTATYQVLEGGYSSNADAATALNKWKSNAAITKTAGTSMVVAGPHSLSSGSYTTKADALKAAASFGAQGLDTAIGMSLNSSSKLEFTVLVGLAGTEAELELVKAVASKVSSKLTTVKGNDDMLVMRVDHSATGAANSSDELYLYNSHMVVSVKAASNDNVTVAERSERSYRGTMEAGSLNGQMYVVNELPLEQYLYSVVAIEMFPSWPIEALKAQAVAARTYALYSGNGFTVAHVVDTTTSQAYYGVNSEHQNTTAAVDATKGEVLMYNGKLVETLFSSSAGGRTADAKEIWGNEVAYLKTVESPDSISEKGLHSWYRVVLPNGKVGYIREDLVKDSGMKNAAGKPILSSNTDGTNIRRNPLIQSNVQPIEIINSGVQLVALEKVVQSNAMTWRRGPYSSEEMLKTIGAKLSINGPITSLEVTKTGPSGRATEVSVNGKALAVPKPVDLRGVLGVDGTLQSTYFTIEQTGQVVVLGASSNKRTKQDGADGLQVLGANGQTSKVSSDYLFVLDGSGNVRAATAEAGFQIDGKGNGHGVGLSQYGAYGLASEGYDYQYILKYYYAGSTIAKDE